MKDLKKEINSAFMGDRTKLEYLAQLTTEQLSSLNQRIQMLENTMAVMQEALVRIESHLISAQGENHEE